MTDHSDIRNTRLLVLTSTFPRWEGDREPPFVFELCRRLTRDFEVIVLAPHAFGARTVETLEGISVRRFRYFFEKWEALAYEGGILPKLKRNPAYYLLVPFFITSQVLALRRILKREDIDVIHAHWLIPQGLSMLLCKALPAPRFPSWLCTSHGSDLLGLRGTLFGKLKERILKSANVITVVSQAMQEQALRLGALPDRLFIMPMGIDTTRFHPPAPSTEKKTSELLFVGRLVSSKAVDSLIQAMPIILTQYPQTTLTIVGEGPERTNLETLTKSLKIESNVLFTGAIANTDLPPLYRRATLFITPSYSEGFGLTLAEAMACGCAVIASDLPAIRELVVHDKTGLLVAPGDSEDIARKALTLLSNPACRAALERAGRDAVCQRFGWDMVAKNYAGLLATLCPASRDD